MSVYLSVDLDYWINGVTSFSTYDGFDEDMPAFFDRLNALPIKPMVAMEHHGLLEHINSSGCSSIHHVDFHTDLALPHASAPTEGDFLYYVLRRKEMEYHWHLPNYDVCHLDREGHCEDWNMFEKGNRLFARQSIHRGTKRLPWKKISQIGISLSPNWVYYGGAEEVIEKYLFDWATPEVQEGIKKWRDLYYDDFSIS